MEAYKHIAVTNVCVNCCLFVLVIAIACILSYQLRIKINTETKIKYSVVTLALTMHNAIVLYCFFNHQYTLKKGWQQYFIMIVDTILFAFYISEYFKLIAARFVLARQCT